MGKIIIANPIVKIIVSHISIILFETNLFMQNSTASLLFVFIFSILKIPNLLAFRFRPVFFMVAGLHFFLPLLSILY